MEGPDTAALSYAHRAPWHLPVTVSFLIQGGGLAQARHTVGAQLKLMES